MLFSRDRHLEHTESFLRTQEWLHNPLEMTSMHCCTSILKATANERAIRIQTSNVWGGGMCYLSFSVLTTLHYAGTVRVRGGTAQGASQQVRDDGISI